VTVMCGGGRGATENPHKGVYNGVSRKVSQKKRKRISELEGKEKADLMPRRGGNAGNDGCTREGGLYRK